MPVHASLCLAEGAGWDHRKPRASAHCQAAIVRSRFLGAKRHTPAGAIGDCPRYVQAGSEIPSRKTSVAAARERGSAAFLPASHQPAESTGNLSPTTGLRAEEGL